MKRVAVGINNFGKVLLIAIGFSIGLLIPVIHLETIPWLLSIPTTFYIFIVSSWIYSRMKASVLENLVIKRIIPEGILDDDVIEVKIEIINKSFLSLYNVSYIDYYPETLHLVDGYKNSGSIAIPPKSKVIIRYRLKIRGIGRHVFKGFYLTTTDILTLYTIELYDEDIKKGFIRSYPRSLIELNQFSLYARKRYLMGLHRTVELGYSMEFKDIRRYSPGDIIRFIDWKATARRNRLMIREFHREVENDIVIMIRVSQGMLAGRLGRRKYDYIVNSISRLIMEMINASDRIGLVIFGGVKPLIKPLSKIGIAGYREILDILTDVPFNIERDLPVNFSYILSRLGIRGKTLFIYITDLEDEDELNLIEILKILRHNIYVISPSTTRFAVEEKGDIDRITFQILRYREDRLRSRRIERLLSKDVLTIDVGPDTIFEEIFERISRFKRLTPT